MALRYANEVILMDDKKVRQVTIKKAERLIMRVRMYGCTHVI